MSGLTEGDLDCGVVAYVEKLQSIIDHETAKKADFATVAKVGIDTTDYTSQFEHKIVKNMYRFLFFFLSCENSSV